MKKPALYFSFIIGALFFIRCSPKTTGTTASGANTSEVAIAEVKRNYTETQMQEGKKIWEASCDKCHKLYQPESHSVKAWERILPRMTKRAKLDDSQSGMVRAYILTHTTKMD